jgi:hypothetical protein
MVTGLSKPLDHNEPYEFESDNETAKVEIDLQLSMQEKLGRANDKEMHSKISSELAIFEVKSKRDANLESCYENSISVPPSSVEPEVIFFRMWKNCYPN